MNCREYRELIDDALDTSLNGALGHRVKLHLEHCTTCRDYYEHRQKEHVVLFAAMNAAYADVHLPPGFADNVIEMIALEGARRKPFFARVPRWALIAASLVAMAGFVFAAAVGIRGVEAANQDDIAANQDDTAASRDGDADGEGASAFVVPSVPSGASAPIANYQLPTTNYQLETYQGATTMTKKKAAAAALTAALAAAPLAAANGDEYQFIDPATYPAANPFYPAASVATTLETGAMRIADTARELEARSRANGASVAIALNAAKFRTFIMTVR